MKKKSLLAALGLAFGLSLASGANAFTYNLTYQQVGSTNLWQAGDGGGVVGTFYDVFNFTLPSAIQPAADGVSATVSSWSNVSLTSFDLWDATTNSIVSTGSLCTTGCLWELSFFIPSGNHSLINNYYFAVNGSGTGTAGAGSYRLDTQVTAVPEPETYAMLLIGLGLLGFTARRRKSSSNLA